MSDIDNSDDPTRETISDSEWAQRRLCPDGNCIGVIGADGRCKECGRPGGDDPAGVPDAVPPMSPDDATDPEASPADAIPSEGHEDTEADHWANRRLCPDGNCIGVIGADGRCKECGRPDKGR